MVKRELYMNKIRRLIDKDIIKAITGIKQCGKSYILNLIIQELLEKGIKKENILPINLESIKYKHIKTTEELDKIVINLINKTTDKAYLFFDEIHNIKEWEKSIDAYKVDFNCDIYITGSNSNLLSGELASHLTGRYMEIKIYPFSFKEFIEYKLNESNEIQNNYQINEFNNSLSEFNIN